MKSYILDTCALVYALGIGQKAQILQDLIDANEVFISAVNLWEIAIKAEKGKIQLSLSLKDLAEKSREALNGILNVEPDDILKYREIMLKTKHRNPFDLMLVAQAESRSLSIVTSDQVLLKEFKRITKAI